MHDPLDEVLRLVAEGRLSPDEAAPLIEALAAAREATARARDAGSAARDAGGAAAQAARAAAGAARIGFAFRRPDRPGAPRPPTPPTPPGPPRRLRVQVRDGGRTVVDLQLPGVLAELAGTVPGIPEAYVARIREALRTGLRGPIVDVVDEDGSGITITVD